MIKQTTLCGDMLYRSISRLAKKSRKLKNEQILH